MYILGNALKNIGRNKGRNVLVGIIIIGIIIATGTSFIINTTTNEIIEDYKSRFGSKVNIIPDNEKMIEQGDSFKLEPITINQYKRISESDTLKEYSFSTEMPLISDKLKAIDEDIEDENSMSMSMGMDQNGEMVEVESPKFRLMGVMNLKQLNEFNESIRKLKEGNIFKEVNECIISEDFAKLNKIKVGDEIEVSDPFSKENIFKMKVSGIYVDLTEAYRSMAFKEAFSNRRNEIITSFDTILQHISKENLYIDSKFILKSPDLLNKFKEEANRAGISDSYVITTDDESYKKIVSPVEGLKKVTNMFGLVVIIFGSIVLIILSYMSIRERKYEVGVLRAMGMKKKNIAIQFLIEMFVITSFCLICGTAISTISAQPIADTLLKKQIQSIEENKIQNDSGSMIIIEDSKEEDTEPISELKVNLNIEAIVKISLVSLLLALITSIMAISYITKYEPMKILSERN